MRRVRDPSVVPCCETRAARKHVPLPVRKGLVPGVDGCDALPCGAGGERSFGGGTDEDLVEAEVSDRDAAMKRGMLDALACGECSACGGHDHVSISELIEFRTVPVLPAAGGRPLGRVHTSSRGPLSSGSKSGSFSSLLDDSDDEGEAPDESEGVVRDRRDQGGRTNGVPTTVIRRVPFALDSSSRTRLMLALPARTSVCCCTRRACSPLVPASRGGLRRGAGVAKSTSHRPWPLPTEG